MILYLKHNDMTYYNLHTHDLSLSTDRKLSICNLPYKNSFTSPDAYPGVYFSAGIHPWHIASTDPMSLTSQLSRIAESPQLLAIGECGLDKLTDTPIDIQITIFKQQIEIAENSKKPMIIHCVKAFNELIKLRKETAARQEWIIHGFRQNIVWEGTGYYPAHGQYHENYDLHPGFGERKGGGCGEGVFQCRFPAQGAPGGAGRRGVQAGGPAVCPDAGIL